jgi:hypothetical protein
MAEQRLNQVLAVEQGLKSRIEEERTSIYHLLQKPSLFNGLTRTYRPLRDGGDTKPAENQRVQQRADELMQTLIEKMTTLWNITATKDYANCNAKGNIVVNGETILEDVPTAFLLYLEKELVNVRTLLTHLPLLDPGERWSRDANDNLWKGDKIEKQSTAKVQTGIVLYEATKEHPAQTQLITVDQPVGIWEEMKMSGAFAAAAQKQLLNKVEVLITATKKAREGANLSPAPEQAPANKIFNWLFKP